MIKWFRTRRLSITVGPFCCSRSFRVASSSSCIFLSTTCHQQGQFKNNYFTEMCSGSEAGSYVRLIDFVYHTTLDMRVIKMKRGQFIGF